MTSRLQHLTARFFSSADRFKTIPLMLHLVGAALLIASALSFLPQHDTVDGSPRLTQAVVLFMLGGVVLGFSTRVGQNVGAMALPRPGRDAGGRSALRSYRLSGQINLLPYLAGAGMLVAFGLVTGLNIRLSHHIQFLMFLAGVLLLIRSVSVGHNAESDAALSIPHWEWLVIGMITLFALILRAWRLGSLHVLVDETNFLDGLLQFWLFPEEGMLRPMAAVAPFTRLHAYWETWTVALVGRNLAGFRMASAVVGALNVTAVWWLARHLFLFRAESFLPPRVLRALPLLAALILATFPPHLHFSRLALNNISDPLFGTLALAFLARAHRSGNARDFLFAGMCLGLTHYFHHAGQLFWMGLVGIGLYWSVLRRQHMSVRGIGLFILTAVVMVFPLYMALALRDMPLIERFNEGRLSSDYWVDLLITHDPETIHQHLIRTMRAFLIYVHIPDETIFYAGETALVLPVLIPAMFYGFWLCVWRGPVILVVWPLLVALGSTLLRDSATATRFIPAFPALAILMAVGLCGIVVLLAQRRVIQALFVTLLGLTLVGVWPLLLAFGSSYLRDNDFDIRVFAAFPAAALLGIMIVWGGGWMVFRRFSHIRLRPVIPIVLIALALSIYHVHYYVDVHLPLYNIEHREGRVREDVEDAILWLVEDERFQPGTTHVHMFPNGGMDYFSANVFLGFLSDGYTVGVEPIQTRQIDYFDTFRPDFDHAVFVLADDQQANNWVLAHDPDAGPPETNPYPDYAGKQFVLYRVEAQMERPDLPVEDKSARHERDLLLTGIGAMLLASFIFWRRPA